MVSVSFQIDLCWSCVGVYLYCIDDIYRSNNQSDRCNSLSFHTGMKDDREGWSYHKKLTEGRPLSLPCIRQVHLFALTKGITPVTPEALTMSSGSHSAYLNARYHIIFSFHLLCKSTGNILSGGGGDFHADVPRDQKGKRKGHCWPHRRLWRTVWQDGRTYFLLGNSCSHQCFNCYRNFN